VSRDALVSSSSYDALVSSSSYDALVSSSSYDALVSSSSYDQYLNEQVLHMHYCHVTCLVSRDVMLPAAPALPAARTAAADVCGCVGVFGAGVCVCVCVCVCV
jgi:hypothetical protein